MRKRICDFKKTIELITKYAHAHSLSEEAAAEELTAFQQRGGSDYNSLAKLRAKIERQDVMSALLERKPLPDSTPSTLAAQEAKRAKRRKGTFLLLFLVYQIVGGRPGFGPWCFCFWMVCSRRRSAGRQPCSVRNAREYAVLVCWYYYYILAPYRL